MTYTITKIRAYFTRCGYAVQLLNDDGTPRPRYLQVEGTRHFVAETGPATFFGQDGRKVRADAIRWARAQI